jgi:hypothetical protein
MIFALTLLAAASALLVSAVPRLDRTVAWALGAALVLLAGFRTGGFDYEEYLLNIESVRAAGEADWTARLFFAKDPLFLFIIEFVGTLTEDPRLIFVVVAAVSVFTKVAATASIPHRRTYFMALYTVLLAPGLEFAAIRAGMAIGLLMLALSSISGWRAGWAVLAVLGHYSVVIAWGGRLLSTHRWMIVMVMALILPLAVPSLIELGQEDPRYLTYFHNHGSLSALVLPMLTLGALVSLKAARVSVNAPERIVSDEAMMATVICVTVALMLALPSVTVSFRIMEIAWALMLAQWLALGVLRNGYLLARMVSGGLLVTVLVLTNVLGERWAILLQVAL